MRTFAAFSAALILVICASLSVAQDEEYELQISATVLELKVDTRTHVDMQAGDVDLQGFSVEVPDGTKSVYVNVLDATADIDLMLCDAKLESTPPPSSFICSSEKSSQSTGGSSEGSVIS